MVSTPPNDKPRFTGRNGGNGEETIGTNNLLASNNTPPQPSSRSPAQGSGFRSILRIRILILFTLKLTSVGTSAGVVIPEEMLTRLTFRFVVRRLANPIKFLPDIQANIAHMHGLGIKGKLLS